MPGASQFIFGSGLLYGIRNDIVNQSPRAFGTVQDVSVDFDGDIKDLFGQFQFPVDVARGKTKIACKAKFATVSGGIFNDLFFGQTLSTGQQAFAFNEAVTLPAVTTQATSAGSAAGSTTLTFTSVPAAVSKGSIVRDVTTAAAITAGTYVTAKTATTVTISAPVTATPVANAALTPLTDLGAKYQLTGVPFNEVVPLLSSSAAGNYNFLPTLGAYQFADADA